MAARVEELERQLAAAAIPSDAPKTAGRWKLRVWPLAGAFTAVCLVMASSLIFKYVPSSPLAISSARAEDVVLSPKIQPLGELPADPQAALTMGIDRLNTAIARVTTRSPEETLRLASGPGQDCVLVWTNHLPSVVFRAEPRRQNSLAHTLSDCAEAGAKIH